MYKKFAISDCLHAVQCKVVRVLTRDKLFVGYLQCSFINDTYYLTDSVHLSKSYLTDDDFHFKAIDVNTVLIRGDAIKIILNKEFKPKLVITSGR